MTLSYMPGFGNDFETESLPGALPQGQNSPQRPRLRALCRTAFRLALHRAARHQRALLALPHPAERQAHRALPRRRLSTWKTAPNVGDHELALGQLRWNPMPMPDASRPTSSTGMRTMTTAGDVARPGRHGGACLCRQRLDGRRSFLRCRRRAADRAASRAASRRHRDGRHRASSRARSASCRAAWCSRSSSSTATARGYVCENYGAKFTLARPRPDRRQLPGQSARLQDAGRRASRTRRRPCRLLVKWCGAFHVTEIGHSPLDVVAWHGNYAPYKYDLATLFAGRRDPVRPSRPVDLHGADRAVRRGRHRQYRLRHLPAALAGGRAHVPAALVSPQHHERVHGADPRPVRRQGGRLRARRHQPAQHDAGAWTRCRRLRQGDHASELKPVKLDDTMAFMFETRFPQHADPLCGRSRDAAGRLHRLLDRPEEALQRHAGGRLES